MGCSEGKIEEIEEVDETVTSEYYVKYCYGGAASSMSWYYFDVEYTMDISNNSIIQGTASYEERATKISDEKICGPFKYGDKVSIKMSYTPMPNIFLEIYISKNNSPFALKKYDYIDHPSGARYIDYTIDY